MIIYSEEFKSIRESLYFTLKKIDKQKKLRILDIGGGKNSFLRELVTDIIDLDIIEVNNPDITLHIGSLYDESFWNNFNEKEFDFISCTQTLEDLRDPQYVVNKMSCYSKAGLITVPNQYQETSNIESKTWVGNYHHRYIFNFTSEGFFCFPKFHYVNNNINSAFIRAAIMVFERFLNKKPMRYPLILSNKKKYPLGYYPFGEDELSLVFIDSIDLNYYNDDYCGKNPKHSAEILNELLLKEFNKIQSDLFSELSSHLIHY